MAPKAKNSGSSPKRESNNKDPKRESNNKDAAKAGGDKGAKKKIELPADGSKPPRPDKEAFEKRIEDVAKEVEAKRAEIQKVIGTIDSKSEGKDKYEESRSGLFEELSNVKKQRQMLIEQKQEMNKQIRAEKEEERGARFKLRDMEKAGKDLNEESLDAKINSLEYQLNVRLKPLTLKEEKAILKEIKDLKSKRPAAIRHTKELEALKAGATAGETVLAVGNREENMKSVNEKLDKMKEDSARINASIDKLKEERNGKLENLKPLIDKRQDLRNQVSSLLDKKKEIVEERKQAFDMYREYEKKIWEEKKKREQGEWDKWRAEQAADQAKAELEQPNPFLEETTLLEQTIDYCRGLLPSSSAVKEDSKQIEYNNPEGYAVMKTKKEREAEMYFEATKGKKGKKGANRVLAQKEEEGLSESKSNKSIKHTAETFKIFEQLKVATPMTVGDIPALQMVLEQKLDAVNNKVRKWEEERKEKVKKAAEGRTSSTEDKSED